MKRDTNKLIMFDYGGIVEEYSTKGRRIYDYRDVMIDALMWACGLRVSDSYDWDEWRREHLDWMNSHSFTGNEFTGFCNEEERKVALAKVLDEICVTHASKEAADMYIQYIRNHAPLIPINKDMINLQIETKEKCLIGGMTNIGVDWLPTFRKVTESIGYDYVFESCIARTMKPDPMAYAAVEEMSGLSGKQILLIDDNCFNVVSAIQHGWCGYWVSLDNYDTIVSQVSEAVTYFLDNDVAYCITSIPVQK